MSKYGDAWNRYNEAMRRVGADIFARFPNPDYSENQSFVTTVLPDGTPVWEVWKEPTKPKKLKRKKKQIKSVKESQREEEEALRGALSEEEIGRFRRK
jgi:hypothetical protein